MQITIFYPQNSSGELSLATLWVLEKVDHTLPRITDMLIGDFAVRAVASTQSLRSIIRINGTQMPDAIVIDHRTADWSLAEIATFVRQNLAGCVCIAIISRNGDPNDLPEPVQALQINDDSMQFVVSFRNLLSKDSYGKAGSIVRYRDLVLDLANLKLKFGETSDVIILPQKELQLLRLLVSHCGQTICRDEISSKIWQGVKVSPRTIDSHISRLRAKLVGSTVTIRSIYGGGYLLR